MTSEHDPNPQDFLPEDFAVEAGAEYGLRAQMVAQEWFTRYGPVLVAVVVLGILSIGGYGMYRSSVLETARTTSGEVADVLAKLPAPVLQLAQARAGFGEKGKPEDLTKAADSLVAIGDGASGNEAVAAWLTSAELYRLADAPDARRTTLEKAKGAADGVLQYVAISALANLDIEQGKVSDGLDRLRAATSSDDTFIARRATLDLAEAQEATGDAAGAIDTLTGFLTRFADAPEAESASAMKTRLERLGSESEAKPAAPAEAAPAQPADEG